MKKYIAGLALITTTILGSYCFAGEKKFDVKYTKDQFNSNPAFHCSSDVSTGFLGLWPGDLVIVADPALHMSGGDRITGGTKTLRKYYFQATAAPQDDAHVSITLSGRKVDANSQLVCDFGTGGKKLYK